MFQSQHGDVLALLPNRRPPWGKFLLSMGTQGLVIFLVSLEIVLGPHSRESRTAKNTSVMLISAPLTNTDAPVPFRRQPEVKVDSNVPRAIKVSPPDFKRQLRTSPELPPPDIPVPSKPVELPQAAPLLPKQTLAKEAVKTNVFSNRSSASSGVDRNPLKVQTGGFGDPRGVAVRSDKSIPVNVARTGSFDLPVGPGHGDGNDRGNGAEATVRVSGFGYGASTSKSTSSPNPPVQHAGFSSESVTNPDRDKLANVHSSIVPAEILSKPKPAYTDEARKLRIEGEVLLEAVFEASGTVRVTRVIQGLGHGLDEAAIEAAERIRFNPASQGGHPKDSTLILHIVFQLT